MTRSALRCAIGAGFLMTAMASASAQVLEIGADLSPTGLDPHLITAFPSFMIVNGNIYEGLTAIDKDLKVTPGLAESWTVSPDGKTYTFKLRSGCEIPRRLRDGGRRRGVVHQARAEQGDRLSAGKPAREHREREGGRSADRRTDAEGAVGAAAGLARHHRDRAELGRDRQGRAAEAADRNRARSSSPNGSRTASCCCRATMPIGRRACRSSPASSSTSCRNWRPGRSASSTANTPCCRTSMRRRLCSSRASRA